MTKWSASRSCTKCSESFPGPLQATWSLQALTEGWNRWLRLLHVCHFLLCDFFCAGVFYSYLTFCELHTSSFYLCCKCLGVVTAPRALESTRDLNPWKGLFSLGFTLLVREPAWEFKGVLWGNPGCGAGCCRDELLSTLGFTENAGGASFPSFLYSKKLLSLIIMS